MRKPLLATAAVAVLGLSLVGCGSPAATPSGVATPTTGQSSTAPEWPSEITIALVPSIEGEDLAEALDPLTSYLSENLGIKVTGVVANNYAATVEALGADQAQVIITDAGSLYNAIEQYQAKLVLRDVRFGATSYASVAFTNNPGKYCSDTPVKSTYAASGIELSYCNGIEKAGETATGQGPAALDALKKITEGTKVALQAATSPAGFQYPVVAMREAGLDTDKGIVQVPVEGNNNAVLAVYNGDAEVSFGYWDARTTVTKEAPDVADKVVAFAYTDMIPNGGVAVSSSLPEDLVAKLTALMDGYADSSPEAADVMFKLVGLSDWTTETAPEEITRYGEILQQFKG